MAKPTTKRSRRAGAWLPYTYLLTSGTPPGLQVSGAQIYGTPTAAGNFGLRLIASDQHEVAGYVSYSLVIAKANTTTLLQSSLNPSGVGQAVTFSAAVTSGGGAPTGTVTFKEGTSTLGTGTLANGVAQWTTTGLGVGSHSVTAQYGGDANFNASTSSVLVQVVTAQPPSPRRLYLPLIRR